MDKYSHFPAMFIHQEYTFKETDLYPKYHFEPSKVPFQIFHLIPRSIAKPTVSNAN